MSKKFSSGLHNYPSVNQSLDSLYSAEVSHCQADDFRYLPLGLITLIDHDLTISFIIYLTPRMALPRIKPMVLERFPSAFSHPDWIFEIKHDGFRAMAYIEAGEAKLVSRRDHLYKSFGSLSRSIVSRLETFGTLTGSIASHAKDKRAILDGEIVSLDHNGIAQFKELMYRRHEPRFYAFDVLWLDDRDLRGVPLIERKSILRRLIPKDCTSLLYVDHLEEHGERLFEICCSLDLEGIVAKYKYGKYVSGPETTWAKIKNPQYSQIVGRDEMFKKKAAA